MQGGAPKDLTTILTLTAPIRVPGRTVIALKQALALLLQSGVAGSERSSSLHGNRASLRLVGQSFERGGGLVGFVHKPDVPAARLLDLAEHWLRSGARRQP